MDLDKHLFGRLTIGSERIGLGNANVPILMQRIISQLQRAKPGKTIRIVIELSNERLPEASIMNREQALTNEMSQLMADQSEEAFPGVTVERVQEVMSTQCYQEYARICEPHARIGLDADYIAERKDAYQRLYPDCAPHFPRWVES